MEPQAILWDFQRIQTPDQLVMPESVEKLKNVAIEPSLPTCAIQYDIDGDLEGKDGWERENEEESDVASRCVGSIKDERIVAGIYGVSISGIDMKYVTDSLGVKEIWFLSNPRVLNEEDTQKLVEH